MGQFNQARQSMSSISKAISEAYTGPQRPSWASLTRTGNPCMMGILNYDGYFKL